MHRTLFERLGNVAIYECRECENEECVPRRLTFHLGAYARCPKCGTFRVTKLKGLDKIDKMFSGPINTLERLAGGKPHHCCFCRIQFYDRRKVAPRTTVQPYRPGLGVAKVEIIDSGTGTKARITGQPGKASSDA